MATATASTLKVQKPTLKQSKLNVAYINPATKHEPDDFIVLNYDHFFAVRHDSNLPEKGLALSLAQRDFLNVRVGESVEIHFISRKYVAELSLIKLSIEMVSSEKIEILSQDLVERIRAVYAGFPFNENQKLYIDASEEGGPILLLTVESLLSADKSKCGILDQHTDISLVTESASITLVNSSPLIKKDFSLSDLGIGGLKTEFGQIFRRAFVQRLFEPEVIKKFGFPHVKGIMLYGPPGTGKTLIARKLGSLLNARPPKIVNGPEILNKYVGQSEENIRNLFADAEAEYRAYGAKSQLHIIIFDEIDAICKRRGTGGSAGAGDQVVNQLLSKMDGVESLDNILVVGMTNRLDMIDEALLRPGRFEIHLEISLPDENARHEIFAIHTRKMSQNSLLDEKVDLKELAALTKNYTGAEIAAVVRSGSSFALERQIELRKAAAEKEDGAGEVKVSRQQGDIRAGQNDEEIRVTMDDMLRALTEVRPAFGVDENDFVSYHRLFYEIAPMQRVMAAGREIFSKLRSTNLYKTTSLLLHGPTGTGKTSLAVRIARESKFPFIKIISPRNLVGHAEYDKVNYIKETFLNAYKSEEACIILDDLEGLIEFVNLGARFSNSILQALKIFTKYEEKNKLCVLGTTSMPEVMRECGLFDSFVEELPINSCTREDYETLCEQNSAFREINFVEPVPIKKLLAALPEACIEGN